MRGGTVFVFAHGERQPVFAGMPWLVLAAGLPRGSRGWWRQRDASDAEREFQHILPSHISMPTTERPWTPWHDLLAPILRAVQPRRGSHAQNYFAVAATCGTRTQLRER